MRARTQWWWAAPLRARLPLRGASRPPWNKRRGKRTLPTPATSAGRPVLDLGLDRRSPVPVYVQISDAIRAMIRSGELQPDSVLPPSQQLCDKLGITRMTLRQAYNVLAREGLVDAQRGRGTFVRRSRI